MKLNEIIDTVATELDLPRELVDNAYKAYWNFIRNSIENLPLKDTMDQETFDTLRTNINIPSLGKLNCTYKRYLGLKNRFSIINKIRCKK